MAKTSKTAEAQVTVAADSGNEYQSSKIVMIRTSQLRHHPENPRKDLGDLTELVESMKKNGVMQNLTVILMVGKEKDYNADVPVDKYEQDPNGDKGQNFYYVLIGNRRLEAAKQAGIKELPCRILTRIPFKTQLGIMLEENMQRNDLTIWEQAQGFQLMLDLGESIETIEKKTGFGRTTILHRVNIAKLNSKVVKEKEQDEGFQLTLKDLYELEKIKSLKTRNQVLKEARNSRDLVWRALQAAELETKEENKKEWVKLFDACGIKEKPEMKDDYSGKFETLEYINLKDKPPKQLKIKGAKKDEELFWSDSYGSLKVCRAAAKAEKKLSKEELERQENEKKKKKIKALTKEATAELLDFVKKIIDGKVEPLKQGEAIPAIWYALLCMESYIGLTEALAYITGKNKWNLSEEEKKTAGKLLEALPIDQQMLTLFHVGLENIEMYDWHGYARKENVKKMDAITKALQPFGFSWSNDELRAIADGTHELFKKPEEKK